MLWVSEYAFYYVRLGEMQLGTITWSKNVYYISLFELIILNRQKKKKNPSNYKRTNAHPHK